MGGGGADVDVLGVLIGRSSDHADAGGEVADDAPDVIVGNDVLGDDGGLVGVGLVVELNDLNGIGLVADLDATVGVPLGGHQLGSVGKANAVLGVVTGHGAGHRDLDGALGKGTAAQDQGQSQDDCKNLLHYCCAPFFFLFQRRGSCRSTFKTVIGCSVVLPGIAHTMAAVQLRLQCELY